jgi:hypothetical protein
MDTPLPFPFRRVREQVAANPTLGTNAGDDRSARDAAAGITTFFQENKQNCDIKTAPWCAQSMEATKDGFKLHGRANRPVGELTFSDQLLVPACFLLKSANVQLPAVLLIEVKDDRSGVARYAGTCRQS